MRGGSTLYSQARDVLSFDVNKKCLKIRSVPIGMDTRDIGELGIHYEHEGNNFTDLTSSI